MKNLWILFFLGFTTLLSGQGVIGDWDGTLDVQGMKLKIVFHVTENNGKLAATMDSPDQGAHGIPMDKTTFENGKLTIDAAAMGIKYTADLDESNQQIKGDFNQGGMSIPLELVRAKKEEKVEVKKVKTKITESTRKVLGDWNGVLDMQVMQLGIVFHIIEQDGELVTTMDSPDQGAKGISTDNTTFENGELKITAGKMKMEYTAKLNPDGSELSGEFNQNGNAVPLKMSREKVAKKKVNRPQNPTDFPYNQEEVKFINPKGGHHLAGTLTTPTDGEFEKVVILISGSGRQNRDEELLGHKPFLVLSDHLTRQGIGVLRYDDRGVAESGGEYDGATSKDFADDVIAAVDFLKNRKDMQGKRIGLSGHSEGGMIAPIVASENSDVDFIVLLAGPGINIKELMMLQTDKMAEAEGAPEDIRKANAMILDKAFSYLKNNSEKVNKEELEKGLFQIFDDGYDLFSEEVKKEMGDKDELFRAESKMLLDDWFLYFMRFEPADFLQKVKCPVLAVNGELDLQVTAKENLEGIRKSLEIANNKDVTIREFKGLNHLFQVTKTGASSEYAKNEETFNVEVLKFVSNWIEKL